MLLFVWNNFPFYTTIDHPFPLTLRTIPFHDYQQSTVDMFILLENLTFTMYVRVHSCTHVYTPICYLFITRPFPPLITHFLL